MSTTGLQVDTDLRVPYYWQVKETLKVAIVSGRWQPGTRLPTEAELCRQFGVSRTTVRQAMSELQHEGFIRRKQGLGTFVAERKISERIIGCLAGFYRDMRAQGVSLETLVLDQRIMPASEAIARELGVSEGDATVRIERLRKVRGEPIVHVVTYIPEELCPGLTEAKLGEGSLYEVLETEYGYSLAEGRRTIEAVSASPADARLLDVTVGTPLVLITGVTYLTDGRPIEYYQAKHRGDRVRFEVRVARNHDEFGAGERNQALSDREGIDHGR